MNSRNWEEVLTNNRLGLEAELFAQEMGMKYKYASRTARLAGDYLGRSVLLELTQPFVARSKSSYGIKCCVFLQIPNQLKLHSKEKSALTQFFQRSIPIAQQNGTNLVDAEYKTSGHPQSFVNALLQSPDFCYSVILLSASVLAINDNQFCCESRGEDSYSYEIPLILEKFYAVANAIEAIAPRNL